MEQKSFKALFSELPPKEVPPQLMETVLFCLASAKRRALKRRVFIFGGLAGLSLVAAVPAFQYFGSEIARTDFFDYFSLIASDGATALVLWKQLTLSLIESLPIYGMTAILSVAFVSLLSLKMMAGAFHMLGSKAA